MHYGCSIISEIWAILYCKAHFQFSWWMSIYENRRNKDTFLTIALRLWHDICTVYCWTTVLRVKQEYEALWRHGTSVFHCSSIVTELTLALVVAHQQSSQSPPHTASVLCSARPFSLPALFHLGHKRARLTNKEPLRQPPPPGRQHIINADHYNEHQDCTAILFFIQR